MDVKHVFETTLFDEGRNLALAVISVPSEGLTMADPGPGAVMEALKLTSVGEIPSDRLAELVAAILATTHVDDTLDWLREEPNAVQVDVSYEARYGEVPHYEPREDANQLDTGSGGGSLKRLPAKIEKRTKRARDMEEFARDAARSGIVPFRESPIDFYPITHILEAQEELRAYLVTVRSNPLALVWFSGGFLLVSAAVGAGGGIRRGLSAGLQYRLLQRFGLPDDLIREEMRRNRPAEDDQAE